MTRGCARTYIRHRAHGSARSLTHSVATCSHQMEGERGSEGDGGRNLCMGMNPYMPTPTIMHGDAWGAHGGSATHGRKGGSGDRGGRSYQVLSKVQGEPGSACEGRWKCAWGVHGGARGTSNKGYLGISCMAYPRLTGDFVFSMILHRCEGKAQATNGCHALMPRLCHSQCPIRSPFLWAI